MLDTKIKFQYIYLDNIFSYLARFCIYIYFEQFVFPFQGAHVFTDKQL